jgi:5-methylcytosine-specific restriction endonuclease McrBC GTP-binding regulatory subunit McrB
MMIAKALFSSLAAKPFAILTGNSGTGKTKLGELFARWLLGDRDDAWSLVAVGADWTDNRNVLGFVNYLRESDHDGSGKVPVYQSTDILDLILRAAKSPLPHFLILDEMNLSHVERYFADFLSAMETTDRRLRLHSENGPLPREQGGPLEVDATIKLPENLFIIGTVNVDETTYMFSPKVLDRANVIEFRVAPTDAEKYLDSGGVTLADIEQAPEGYAEAFLDLSRRARYKPRPNLDLLRNETPPADAVDKLKGIRRVLDELFQVLYASRKEFGYRTMSEILRYAAVDYELTEPHSDWSWESCMDAQILQKILPKLHGSRRQLENLLVQLARYCETGTMPDDKIPAHLQTSPVKQADAPFFINSYRKLCEMIDAVRRDQFVSFIQ